MPPKRKRASSSKNEDAKEEDAQFIATTNDNNNPFEQRLEELLITISREVSDLKNENKTIKETVYEMKESIFEMKNEIKDEMKTQNDIIKHIKHTIDEMKTKVDDNPTPLWNLVTEWKDVFEREILTKLNGTEQKLFSQTCRASRLAIRRAKIELDDKFWIEELSSISQLELAWANYEWGATVKYDDGEEYTKNQEEFCDSVAATNDLALLRWIREEKECAWHYRTSGRAAILGNLEMLKYCVENGCGVGSGTCADAAENGHLECLKYLREKNVEWDNRTLQIAHINNHIDVLTYAVQNKCQGFEQYEQFIVVPQK
jgi:hypothetical protein